MNAVHKKEIPSGVPSDQYFYDLEHQGKSGKCTECGKETPWNPKTHKYARLCGRKECAEKVRETFRKRMMMKYNTDNIADRPEHQRKMLAGRKISGVYKWQDGTETDYVGTYEQDFLHICESMLNMNGEDIQGPSPNTYEYEYEGKKHFYIPDFFIPDMNLEVEVKDGGDNPNMHHKIQEVDKVKENLKDKVMKKQSDHHYIKVSGKDYQRFIAFYIRLRDDELTKLEKRDKVKIL